jgi:hypothetical protein
MEVTLAIGWRPERLGSFHSRCSSTLVECIVIQNNPRAMYPVTSVINNVLATFVFEDVPDASVGELAKADD